MSSLQSSCARVHPSVPTHDHEGTRIDYTDDPVAWIYDPYLGPPKVPPAIYPPSVVSDDTSFLDGDDDTDPPSSDFQYDVIFERPLTPNRPVELYALDRGTPFFVGTFATMQEANDLAFRCAYFRFALRSI